MTTYRMATLPSNIVAILLMLSTKSFKSQEYSHKKYYIMFDLTQYYTF